MKDSPISGEAPLNRVQTEAAQNLDSSQRDGKSPQYSYLGNPMDRGSWWATVHRVTRVGPDLVTKPPPALTHKLHFRL